MVKTDSKERNAEKRPIVVSSMTDICNGLSEVCTMLAENVKNDSKLKEAYYKKKFERYAHIFKELGRLQHEKMQNDTGAKKGV